jgi:CDGSH-type Zn-finger protein
MLVHGLVVQRLARTETGWALEPAVPPGEHALCRCGGSSTMPLCDQPEPYGCFEEAAPTGPAPGGFRWDVPDPSAPGVALKPDGPVRVAGGVLVRYGDEQLGPADRVSLCRCGASRCQPLCDSSHKVVGFRADP